jgi:hypothetical protein
VFNSSVTLQWLGKSPEKQRKRSFQSTELEIMDDIFSKAKTSLQKEKKPHCDYSHMEGLTRLYKAGER